MKINEFAVHYKPTYEAWITFDDNRPDEMITACGDKQYAKSVIRLRMEAEKPGERYYIKGIKHSIYAYARVE